MPVIRFDHTVKVGEAFIPANHTVTVQDSKKYLAHGAYLVSDADDTSVNAEMQPKRAPRKKREA
jgi:hypothetical protein